MLRGSLGVLEDIIIRLVEMTDRLNTIFSIKMSLFCCADHGIANHGISAPKDVTTYGCNHIGGVGKLIARANECWLTVVDVGIEGNLNIPESLQEESEKAETSQGPAMTIE